MQIISNHKLHISSGQPILSRWSEINLSGGIHPSLNQFSRIKRHQTETQYVGATWKFVSKSAPAVEEN